MEQKPAAVVTRLAASLSSLTPMVLYLAISGIGVGLLGLSALPGALVVCGLPLAWLLVDGAAHRATFGMRLMHIHIALANGAAVSAGRCAARILLGVALSPLLPVSLVMARLDERRRMLADWICGTAVWTTPLPVPESRGFEVLPLETRQHL